MSSPAVAGRRLGEYHLVQRIAVGGMAEVFKARQGEDTQPLVLKILLPQFRVDPELVKMFEDEARLTTTLNHPNLVRVLAHGEVAGERYIVMEYVDGPTLSQLLKHLARAGRPLPAALALHLATHILRGLDYIHGRRDEQGNSLEIVHRDVTPGNVLISGEGAIKLGDFGIARHKLRSERTRTGVIKGTVQYMAPEQITGMDIDQRTDIYGVGLILFEMLTGQPYIQGEREVEMLTLAQDPPWRAPCAARPDLEVGFDQLLRPALSRFPEERYPSASSFLSALDKIRAECGERGEEEDRRELATLAREVARSGEELTHGPTISTLASTPSSPASVGASAVAPASGGGSPARPLGLWGGRRWLYAIPAALVLFGAWVALRPAAGPVSTPRLDSSVGAPAPALAAKDARPDLRGDTSPPADAPRRYRTSPEDRPRLRPSQLPRRRADAAVPRPDQRSARPLAQLGPRLARALSTLAGRGILIADLSPALRQRVSAVSRAVRSGGASPGLSTELQQLELALGAVQVDRALVEPKLKRVDHQLARAKQQGLQVQPLRDRSSVALQAYMDGRYGAANRHLNAILSALTAQQRRAQPRGGAQP